MSIHIKGKLPSGRCEAQFFTNGHVAFYDVEGRYLGESKYKELPPHGRLMDADAFFEDFADARDYEYASNEYTIIEADGGADG